MVKVGGCASFGGSFAVSQCFDTLVRQKVDLDVMIGTVFFGEKVCVARVSILASEGGGHSTVTEEKDESVDAFLITRVEIPEHVCTGGIGCRMFLVASIDRRKFDWISNKKSGLLKSVKSRD